MTKLTFAFAALLLLAGCQKLNEEISVDPSSSDSAELRVGTLYGAQIYINSSRGNSGFDYELAERFADFLEKPLKITPYGSIQELYDALNHGDVDVIAAGLSDTADRRSAFRLSPPLYYVNQVIVYREGTRAPTTPESIDGRIAVVSGSAFVDSLKQLQQQNPAISWQELNDKDSEEVLAMIDQGELDYTIADSSTLEINRRFMPELRVGPTLVEDQPIVWLMRQYHSDRLMSKLLHFWHEEKRDGTLDHLVEKYFGHVKRFDYVDTRAFIRAVDSRLPDYRHWFEQYAGELDWRKLAAAAYQESHWNPRARSPTGVRGMMMLTIPTAEQLGVTDRLDPEQSIRGGAQYLSSILQSLPESIPPEERMWFALATYNIGYGHVEDARVLTERLGKNPSAWKDVKQVLPLLQQRKHYLTTRYGYARGSEAVRYVENIRRYYDTLVWIDNHSAQQQLADSDELPSESENEVEAEDLGANAGIPE
ncbi:membrane-bound lytic murein transglycosylase MltF [Shewanella avicenniae]|uniref:Membrane-bound lytic murein transglycosylase F n=1 Tax=Shewanella avicenniae TaxID=2814294 RepID=A0ABX7QUA4_9GAMM|nr:membrane-bound lytic murein transglycosylase MltF [Shewanella avicenniae]QSX34849.1 membrane-bound lytic murein transglycosylase MltF [Shewanella avicenniae]